MIGDDDYDDHDDLEQNEGEYVLSIRGYKYKVSVHLEARDVSKLQLQ